MPLSVRFGADFADVYEVRGTRRPRRGRLLPERLGDECVLEYVGLDNVERRTRIRWTRRPDALEPGTAKFLLRLAPHEKISFEMSVICEENRHERAASDFETELAASRSVIAARRSRRCVLRSSSESLNRWVKRSAADLQMMITDTPHGPYPYAGIPWFSTPFGRDGLITAYELLWPHLLAALDWMVRDGDTDGDGFLEYARQSENGLVQQGWKDSNDSVFHKDGTLAEAPIALCEVQGYAYAAWRGAAHLAEARSDADAALEWHERANHIQSRFEETFWSDDLGTYALALD